MNGSSANGLEGNASVSNGKTLGTNGEETKSVEPVNNDTVYAVNLSQYLFNVGFCGQQWADIQLVFYKASIKLHRIILSRSPYLTHVMSNSGPGSTIHLQIPDVNMTEEAIYLVLQHLYSPALHLVTASNARSVLATSFIFGGMTDLTYYAYAVCRDNLSTSNIIDYVNWLDKPLPSSPIPQSASPSLHHHQYPSGFHQLRSPINGYGNLSQQVAPPPGSVIGFGSIGTPEPLSSSSSVVDSWLDQGPRQYGEWSTRLKEDVVTFLLRTLPSQLTDASPSTPLHTNPNLLCIYSQLPFDLFKYCTESPDLPIELMQDRFAFAKKAIAQRKKRAAIGGLSSGLGQMEESVVLALSSKEDGMDVHITRKPKRSRSALWKVEK